MLPVMEADYVWKPPPSCAALFAEERRDDVTHVTRYRSWPTSRDTDTNVQGRPANEKDIVT